MTQLQLRSDFVRRVALAFATSGLALSLAACTTVEGTNAFQSFDTFEREVMTETAAGIGIIPREEKPDIETPRAALVLPSSNDTLPEPRTTSLRELLPEDSDTVQIDATGLTEEDLRRLRNARVVDLRTAGGRPLTETETRQLAARMQEGGITTTNGQRALYLPPDRYFTTVGNQDLVCLAPSGDLVPLTDPSCPPAIRAALQGS